MPASSPALIRPCPRRRTWLVVALAAGLPWSSGCAAPAPPRDGVDGRWLSLEVVDRDGDQALRAWRHRGDTWVAGAPGERYALRVTNRSGERLLAVVSVDGVNIVSGETAGTQQRGYVLAPWQSALLTGWRKSESEVAAFEFTRLPQSYAALTGRPADVGVIGVAVFREAPRPVAIEMDRQPDSAQRSTASPPAPATVVPAPGGAPKAAESGAAKDAFPPRPVAAARAPAPAEERLGTGHGARESSWTRTVPFERASTTPEELLQLRYDRLDNLVAAGIVPRSYATIAPVRPRPFPVDGDGAGFVPDPPSR